MHTCVHILFPRSLEQQEGNFTRPEKAHVQDHRLNMLLSKVMKHHQLLRIW